MMAIDRNVVLRWALLHRGRSLELFVLAVVSLYGSSLGGTGGAAHRARACQARNDQLPIYRLRVEFSGVADELPPRTQSE